MTLRTHIEARRGGATSGPGRAPGSDGRAGRRARAAGTGRHAAGPVSAAAVRRRGEALFPAASAPPEPGAPEPPAPSASPAAPFVPRPGPVEPAAPPDVAGAPVGARERLRLALRERLPLWAQSRCGLERRSLAALAVVLVVAAAGAGIHFWTGRTQQVAAPEVVTAARPLPEPGPGSEPASAVPSAHSARAEPSGASAPSSASAGAVVVVDVGGKVRRPGVFTLPAGSRVTDALRAAGGIRPGTDLTGLNRARVLLDGEQVVVGLPAEAGGGAPVGAAPGPPGPAGPLSLNAATAEQLDALPGVGPVLARHIVEHRAQHGGFRSVAELRDVNGIGERRFTDLAPLVRP